MRHPFQSLAGFFLGICFVAAAVADGFAAPLPIARPTRETPVDFEREILPILRRNCLACHNRAQAKGDLVLETPGTLIAGGASGPAVVAGNAATSRVFQAAAHELEDLVMPPKGNKSNARDLTPDELELLRLWIDQGAKGEVRTTVAVAWQGMPTNWLSTLAIAFSPDAQFLACSRANQIDVYHLPTRRVLARLVDGIPGGGAHRDAVQALAFSPDGQRIASAGYREVKLWRREPIIRDRYKLETGSPAWSAFDLSADGRLSAYGTASGAVILRDRQRGAFAAVNLDAGPISALAFSPGGERLAAAADQGRLVILRTDPFSQLSRLDARAPLSGLTWLDGGQQLAGILRNEGVVRRWQFVANPSIDAQPLPDLGGLNSPAIAVLGADSQGQRFLVACVDGTIHVYPTLTTGQPLTFSHGSPITSVAITTDRTRAASGGADGSIKLWTLGEVPKMVADLKGDWQRSVESTAAEQSAAFAQAEVDFQKRSEGQAEEAVKKTADILAKASEKHAADDKALIARQGELKTQLDAKAAVEKEKSSLAESVKAAADAFAAADQLAQEAKAAARAATDKVATAQAGKAAEEAGGIAGQKLEELSTRAFAAGQAKATLDRVNAELAPKEKQAEQKLAEATKTVKDLEAQVLKAKIASSTSEGDHTLAQRNAGEAVTNRANISLALSRARETLPKAIAVAESAKKAASEALTNSIAALAFSPDGILLVSAAADGRLLSWNVTGGVPEPSRVELGPGLLALNFDGPSSLQAVTASGSLRVNLATAWVLERSIGTGNPSSLLVDRVNALEFSPDGTWLATGGGEPSRGGELKLWSTADGSLHRDYGSVHSDSILALAFSPSGDRLLSGGADRFTRILDVASGTILRNLEGHSHHVMGVAWRRDGRAIASAGADGIVKVWNPATGERLKNVDGFGKEVVAVAPVGISDQFVAVAGTGQLRVFKSGGEAVRTVTSENAFLQALAVSRDGHLAAAGDSEGVARVWSIDDGKVVAEFPPLTSGSTGLASRSP